MSICNAEKTADFFIISAKTMLRITNAHIHDCRIANSAGRSVGRGDAGWSLRRAWAALFTAGSYIITFGLIFIIASSQ
jgi:hypothetical protein